MSQHGTPAAVDAAGLLARILEFVTRYVIVSHDAAVMVAVWVLHTHALDAADYSPYICIQSATKRCGKSRLLEVLELVVRRPLKSAKLMAAAIFRSIQPGAEPTMPPDEQERLWTSRGINDDLRRVLNSGFHRGENVRRTVGRYLQYAVQEFPTFCPKAFATIGQLPDTVADRSIYIEMKRKLPGEQVERFRRRDADPLAALIRADAERWATSAPPDLVGARPACPAELDDRGRAHLRAPLSRSRTRLAASGGR